MIDWVRNTSVLGNALVCEIDLAVCIYSYVLKKSISSDCVVDIWLSILIQVYNLSIASTFEVENAVVIPAVLIITDQETLRICRKCSLSCSRQTEEDCCILAISICVCGAVHRSHTLEWKEVVHHREHTFLHLSAVPCIDDNLLFACDVESYTCLRV